MIYFVVVTIGIFLWHVYCEIMHRKERKELLNRIMARTYVEYEYYDKKFPEDIKTTREAEKAVIAKEKTALDEAVEITPEQKKFITALEEDWRPETIDTEKLREIVNEYPPDREDRT